MATGAVTESVSMRRREYLFVWAFLGGFVVIFAMKAIPWHPIIVGIAASASGIAIMVFYVAQQRRSRPENEHPRLGDEVYYLGLLYTLTSLCAALVMLFLLDEGNRFFERNLTLEERTDQMIGSFGIALLTTIAGIVIRMTLQGRESASQATIIRIPHVGASPEHQTRARSAEVEGPHRRLGALRIRTAKAASELDECVRLPRQPSNLAGKDGPRPHGRNDAGVP